MLQPRPMALALGRHPNRWSASDVSGASAKKAKKKKSRGLGDPHALTNSQRAQHLGRIDAAIRQCMTRHVSDSSLDGRAPGGLSIRFRKIVAGWRGRSTPSILHTIKASIRPIGSSRQWCLTDHLWGAGVCAGSTRAIEGCGGEVRLEYSLAALDTRCPCTVRLLAPRARGARPVDCASFWYAVRLVQLAASGAGPLGLLGR